MITKNTIFFKVHFIKNLDSILHFVTNPEQERMPCNREKVGQRQRRQQGHAGRPQQGFRGREKVRS